MFDKIITYRTGTQGIFGGCTEPTEVSGPGVKFVPNHTGVFGRVLRPYRTLPKSSVGYLPRKYPRYILVRTLPNIPLGYFEKELAAVCADCKT